MSDSCNIKLEPYKYRCLCGGVVTRENWKNKGYKFNNVSGFKWMPCSKCGKNYTNQDRGVHIYYIEENEYWIDMLGYKGAYKISNHGRIKSLKRKDSIGRKVNEKMISQRLSKEGYFMVKLYNKRYQVHQSMVESFLQTKTDGKNFVVNHIDHNKENNHLSNLEIVTPRQNSNKKHIKHSSKYTGVTWNKNKNKWTSRIYLNGKLKHLGHFDNEYEAHLAYEKELEGIWIDINTLD